MGARKRRPLPPVRGDPGHTGQNPHVLRLGPRGTHRDPLRKLTRDAVRAGEGGEGGDVEDRLWPLHATRIISNSDADGP